MGRPKKGTTLEDRLLARSTVVRHGRWVCWEIDGKKYDGYGHINVNGKIKGAHRAAYRLWVGPIPPGKQIDHLCRNRACIRPTHLEAVKQRVNWERGESPSAVVSRTKVCVNGHDLSIPANVYVCRRKNGRVNNQCKLCRRNTDRKPERMNRPPRGRTWVR
jgi:hypothetical protein